VRFSGILCLVFLFTSITSPSPFAVPKHGCAPAIPPPVSGPITEPAGRPGLLFINEVLLLPHSTWNCSELGTYTPTKDAWVELYNPQSQSFDLYSVRTSLDSGPNTYAFYFPFGSAIAAHSYLVVFPRTSETFLSTAGPILRLLINGIVIDEVTLPPLAADQSYARIPDGGSTWQVLSNPTIDASNTPGQQPTPTPPSQTTTSSGNEGSSFNAGGYAVPKSSSNGQTLVAGEQPNWSTMQSPLSTPNTPAVLPPIGATATSPQMSDNMDTPRKIVFTAVLVALALTLLWCWRLFTHR
jgi:hypothetical protein